MLHLSNDETKELLIDSVLQYCHLSRVCGSTNDLLSAFAKTGVLEQKFEGTPDFYTVLPAVMTERAEILWKQSENMEAVETLRSLIKRAESEPLVFSLASKELVLTTLVIHKVAVTYKIRDPGRRNYAYPHQMKLCGRCLNLHVDLYVRTPSSKVKFMVKFSFNMQHSVRLSWKIVMPSLI